MLKADSKLLGNIVVKMNQWCTRTSATTTLTRLWLYCHMSHTVWHRYHSNHHADSTMTILPHESYCVTQVSQQPPRSLDYDYTATWVILCDTGITATTTLTRLWLYCHMSHTVWHRYHSNHHADSTMTILPHESYCVTQVSQQPPRWLDYDYTATWVILCDRGVTLQLLKKTIVDTQCLKEVRRSATHCVLWLLAGSLSHSNKTPCNKKLHNYHCFPWEIFNHR